MTFSFGPWGPRIAATILNSSSRTSLAMGSPLTDRPEYSRWVAGAGKNLHSVAAREKARTTSSLVRSSSTAMYVFSVAGVSFRSNVLARDLQIAIERRNGRERQ